MFDPRRVLSLALGVTVDPELDAALDALIRQIDTLALTADGWVRVSRADLTVVSGPLATIDACPDPESYIVQIRCWSPDPDCTYHPGHFPRHWLLRAMSDSAGTLERLQRQTTYGTIEDAYRGEVLASARPDEREAYRRRFRGPDKDDPDYESSL